METDPEVSVCAERKAGTQAERSKAQKQEAGAHTYGGGLVLNRRRGRSCSKTGWKKVRSRDELVEGDRSTALASLLLVGSRFS